MRAHPPADGPTLLRAAAAALPDVGLEAFVEAARAAYRAEILFRYRVAGWERMRQAHPGEYLLVQGDALLLHTTSKDEIFAAYEALEGDVEASVLAPSDIPNR